MIEAGLLIHGEGIAVPYDRFRDRVMFPIHDRAGRVVAFGGRAMEPGAKAKYLNSPETSLFHKGALLFNHHRARKTAHERGEIIVVEGYIDAIAMSEAGFANVVAPLGTALTPDQCALLWAMAPEPILCFDGDNAGRKAAFRAIETALPLIGAGKSLRFALLPEGQDPDDLIRAGGAAAMTEVLKGARAFADMLFQRESDGQQFDTPESRAALERRLTDAVEPDRRRSPPPSLSGRPAAPPDRVFRRGPAGRTPTREWRRGPFERRGTPFPPRGPRIGLAEAPLPRAEQARPQGAGAGARDHDSGDRRSVIPRFSRRTGRSWRRWSSPARGSPPSVTRSSPRRPRRCNRRRRSREALEAGGRAEERDRILAACRADAQLVVPAGGRGAFRRRACAAAKPGLASAGRRVK